MVVEPLSPRGARSLALLAAILYPAWGLLMRALVPGAVDPFGERLVVAGCFALSWPLLRRDRFSVGAFHGLLTLCALHFASVVVRNDFSTPYALGQLILVGGVGAAVSQRAFLLGFMTFFAVEPLLALTHPTPTSWVLSAGVVTLGLVFAVILRNRTVLARELESTISSLEQATSRLSALVAAVPDVVLVMKGPSIEFANRPAPPFVDVNRLRENDPRCTFESPAGPRHFDVRSIAIDTERRLVVLRDITTPLETIEKLRHAEKLATVGSVAATVAHEINNPLAWVTGNLNFLKAELSTSADFELRDAVRESLEGVATIATIVRDLKLLARRDATDHEPFEPSAIARGAATLVRAQVEQRARFELNLMPNAPLIAGDGNRLAQVVINLLVNAAQAIPSGDARRQRVGLTVAPADQGRRVRISISDSGPGVPEALREKIFEPYFSTKPRGEGTGLGLAVCRQVVTELGGRMELDSSELGTTFHVELPAVVPEAVVVKKKESDSRTPLGRGLVVDDEPHVLQSLRRVMGRTNQLSLCGSVEDALALLRADSEWDFVLCDLMMPGLTGVDFVKRIEREFPGLRGKVVLMTGGVFTRREREFLGSSSIPVIEKPFSLTTLTAAIEAARSHTPPLLELARSH